MFDLANKTALVVGASGGLGQQISKTLAKAGAYVIAASRNKTTLDNLVTTIKQNGGLAETLELDICKTAEAKKQLASILRPIDILVNNAGIARATSIFDNDEQNYFENIIQTNLIGLWHVTKVIATKMKNQQIQGSIINIGSVNGDALPSITGAAYNASKAAVMHMTKGLVGELSSHKIRINAISPGFFPTDMSKNALERLGEKLTEKIPLKFIPELSDLDATVLYLASNKASRYVTGTVITIDGGISWGGIA